MIHKHLAALEPICGEKSRSATLLHDDFLSYEIHVPAFLRTAISPCLAINYPRGDGSATCHLNFNSSMSLPPRVSNGI